MKDNRELIVIAKEIQGKSDIIVSWKTKTQPFDWIKEAKGEILVYNTDWVFGRKLNPEIKRIWIYVIYQGKKQLMYIMKIIKYEGTGEYSADEIDTTVDSSRLINTYKVETLYQFRKPITLQELEKYKHEETKKPFKSPQGFVYVSSYPELVKDIIAEKLC